MSICNQSTLHTPTLVASQMITVRKPEGFKTVFQILRQYIDSTDVKRNAIGKPGVKDVEYTRHVTSGNELDVSECIGCGSGMDVNEHIGLGSDIDVSKDIGLGIGMDMSRDLSRAHTTISLSIDDESAENIVGYQTLNDSSQLMSEDVKLTFFSEPQEMTLIRGGYLRVKEQGHGEHITDFNSDKCQMNPTGEDSWGDTMPESEDLYAFLEELKETQDERNDMNKEEAGEKSITSANSIVLKLGIDRNLEQENHQTKSVQQNLNLEQETTLGEDKCCAYVENSNMKKMNVGTLTCNNNVCDYYSNTITRNRTSYNDSNQNIKLFSRECEVNIKHHTSNILHSNKRLCKSFRTVKRLSLRKLILQKCTRAPCERRIELSPMTTVEDIADSFNSIDLFDASEDLFDDSIPPTTQELPSSTQESIRDKSMSPIYQSTPKSNKISPESVRCYQIECGKHDGTCKHCDMEVFGNAHLLTKLCENTSVDSVDLFSDDSVDFIVIKGMEHNDLSVINNTNLDMVSLLLDHTRDASLVCDISLVSDQSTSTLGSADLFSDSD